MITKKVNLDWKCLKCNYINFKRNIFCKKCYTDKDGNEYIFTDWICHKCFIINEIDCRVGKCKKDLKCENCEHFYSLQNKQNLTYDMCIENDHYIVKKIVENLNIFVDWYCMKNLHNGINLCIKLLCRNLISKNTIVDGINNITAAKNPFTNHSTSCNCDRCNDLD